MKNLIYFFWLFAILSCQKEIVHIDDQLVSSRCEASINDSDISFSDSTLTITGDFSCLSRDSILSFSYGLFIAKEYSVGGGCKSVFCATPANQLTPQNCVFIQDGVENAYVKFDYVDTLLWVDTPDFNNKMSFEMFSDDSFSLEVLNQPLQKDNFCSHITLQFQVMYKNTTVIYPYVVFREGIDFNTEPVIPDFGYKLESVVK